MSEERILCSSLLQVKGNINSAVARQFGEDRFSGHAVRATLIESPAEHGDQFPSHVLCVGTIRVRLNWLFTLHPKPYPESEQSQEQRNLHSLMCSPYTLYTDERALQEGVIKLQSDDGELSLYTCALSEREQRHWLSMLGYAVACAVCEDGFRVAPCGRLRYLHHTSLSASLLLPARHPMLLRTNVLLRLRIRMDGMVEQIQRVGGEALLYPRDFLTLLQAVDAVGVQEPSLLRDNDVSRIRRVAAALGSRQLTGALSAVRQEWEVMSVQQVSPVKDDGKGSAEGQLQNAQAEALPEPAISVAVPCKYNAKPLLAAYSAYEEQAVEEEKGGCDSRSSGGGSGSCLRSQGEPCRSPQSARRSRSPQRPVRGAGKSAAVVAEQHAYPSALLSRHFPAAATTAAATVSSAAPAADDVEADNELLQEKNTGFGVFLVLVTLVTISIGFKKAHSV